MAGDTDMLFLLYYFFATLVFNGRRAKPKCFSEKQVGYVIFISKTALQKLRFDSMFHENW